MLALTLLAAAAVASPEEAAKTPPLVPLVDALAVTVYRTPFVGLERCPDCRLPVRPGGSADGVRNTAIGGASSDHGGWVRVFARGLGGERDPALGLDVSDPPHAGLYRGRIDVDPANPAAGNVALVVAVKHEWPFPVVVLGLSVWAALHIKRYLGLWRGLWTLREKEAALGAAALESEAAFAAAAHGHGFAGLSVQADLMARRRVLSAGLDALGRTADALNPDSLAYRAIDVELDALAASLAQWTALAARLGALDDALQSARAAAAAVPADLRGATTGGRPPRAFDAAVVLTGPQAVKLADLPGLAQQIDLERAFLVAWDEEARDVAALRAVVPDPSAGAAVKAVHDALAAIVTRLWYVVRTDDVERMGLKDAIVQARAAIDRLPPEPARTPVRAAAPTPVASSPAPFPPGGDAPANDAARRTFYADLRRRWDTAIGWLAFAVALATGLNQLYLDQPFGTPRDYLALALLGLGTRAALDTLGTVLDRWIRR